MFYIISMFLYDKNVLEYLHIARFAQGEPKSMIIVIESHSNTLQLSRSIYYKFKMIQGAAMARSGSRPQGSRDSSPTSSEKAEFGPIMSNGQDLSPELEKLRREKINHVMEIEKYKVYFD